jgi:O-phosphoseryl-tRNA synthetase
LGKLNPKEILDRVKLEGFEKVWLEGAQLLPKTEKRLKLVPGRRGASHPLFDILQKLRQTFLDFGFMEVSNPVIVDEVEVFKQYGPEVSVILDRCYYLATLPRPDIGLSKAKCAEIKALGVPLTDKGTTALQGVLRGYKRGEIDADDFVEKLAEALKVSDVTATLILSKVFPEFAALKPQSSALTLRSHMTSAWFPTLQALQHKVTLPIKLFSVGIRFRREQREDPTHLRVHNAASCVIMDHEVNIEDGEEITRAMLKPLGFENFRFVKKVVTSKYYAPGTEYEGYIFHSALDRWVEVVNYGLYSPIALAEYGLEYPVLNVGIGVERVALALYGETDIRHLVYPQFYAPLSLDDAEIAKMVEIDIKPESEVGTKIQEAIKSAALLHAEEPSPCEFLAYEGKIMEKGVKVYIYETDVDTKLLGPAALNRLYIYDGNILGIPEKGMKEKPLVKEAREKGISLGFNYLDAVASLAAAKIEEALDKGLRAVNVRVKMAKHPSDVNIRIDDVARRYITGEKKKIEVAGPVFIGIRAEFPKP